MTSVLDWVCDRSIPVQFREADERFIITPIVVRHEYRPPSGGAFKRRPRLLLLDDNPVFLRALGRLLESHSFHVDMEGCHKAAYNRFADMGSAYDLALVDVNLKGSSGWDFAKKISRLPGSPPILLMSGEVQSISRDAPKNVKGVLTKPFSVKRLKEEIQSWSHSA